MLLTSDEYVHTQRKETETKRSKSCFSQTTAYGNMTDTAAAKPAGVSWGRQAAILDLVCGPYGPSFYSV